MESFPATKKFNANPTSDLLFGLTELLKKIKAQDLNEDFPIWLHPLPCDSKLKAARCLLRHANQTFEF